jgi:type IV fimbrial biogenesis protein FimT
VIKLGKQIMNNKISGVTLIELLVTLAIAAIILRAALPGFSAMIARNQITTQTNAIVLAIGFARSEAMKGGSTVRLVAIQDADFTDDDSLASCTAANEFCLGYCLVLGTTDDCGDTIIRRFDNPGDLRVDSFEDITELRFDGMGALAGTNSAVRNIDVCSSTGLGRRVNISLIGRAKAFKPGSSNPPSC